ncbi:MAG: hypothetical protein O2819_03925 [Planctomycetota bacterium]|nr:hypothetical protein [Planctomycetota bacterium]MDA1106624.1 hypothetical protein [Planctomycetota bacterium]
MTGSGLRFVRSRVARGLGFTVGLALIGLAVWSVSRDAAAWDRLGQVFSKPAHLAGLAVCVALNLAISGLVFHRLYRPVAKIGVAEMELLVASSSLLNYLPAKAGLAGRALYHTVMHGVPLGVSVRLILMSIAGTVLSCIVLAGVVIVAPSEQSVIVAWPLLAVLVWCAPRALRSGALATAFAESVAMRFLDLGVWCVRYWIVFGVLDVSIDPRSAAMAGITAVLIGLAPFGANGLGLREWAIAGLGGMAGWTADVGLSADLLNRAVDLVVVVPIGSVCTMIVTRRLGARLGTHVGGGSSA